MAEYIMDWNRAIPAACESCDPCIELGCKHVYRATAQKREKIVRCKDCCYYGSRNNCVMFNARAVRILGEQPNGFCAWGVRKDERL